MPQPSLPVVETFRSIQGEGYWAGSYATFIRLAGCPIRCDFCDSEPAWGEFPEQPISELIQAVQTSRVVITGGEPLMHEQKFRELMTGLLRTGHYVEVETSGALPWPKARAALCDLYNPRALWVTVSPKAKVNYHVHPSVEVVASAYKYVVRPDFDESAVVAHYSPVYLQPEWDTPGALERALTILKEHDTWRLSIQTHKYLNLR